MSSSSLQPKQLSIGAIASSPEIQSWLLQFPETSKPLAISMLLNLKFISYDVYERWLHRSVFALPHTVKFALYSVRKLGEGAPIYWEPGGIVASRPGEAQGSEDFVSSIIASLVKGHRGIFLNHPSLQELRIGRIRNLIIVDDSIGSGKRVSDFILSMQRHPSLLSWWNLGIIRIHVFSYARSREAESRIIANIRGSDHGKRKYRKSTKLNFHSEIVYGEDFLSARWGMNSKGILRICKNIDTIPIDWRLGYGNVMSNIVFYNSVPNNLPGALWYSNNNWSPLFNGRSLPEWTKALLDYTSTSNPPSQLLTYYPPEIILILRLIKRGNRRTQTLALKANRDPSRVVKLLALARDLGLISEKNHLTMQGREAIFRSRETNALPEYDRSLYIPSSWCG